MNDLIDRAAVFKKVEEHINMHKDIDWNSYRACLGLHAAIANLPATPVDALVDAAERLAAVLDRHSGKGPIPDVEIMFCWMAAQDVRAALAAYRGEAK